ncbi:MAG: aldo/keto reductase [Candidatus Obscuribacterales bacterium]
MKLALGTAQFGMNYGATNETGQVGLEEVRAILDLAQERGVEVLDTAFQYGESEAVLGLALPPEHGFKIITKTPSFKTGRIEPAHAEELERVFRDSLARLRQSSVYGLLVHHAPDLTVEGSECLLDLVEGFKSDGLVKKIGVSVYNSADLDAVLARWRPDIVQLPLNVLDQRMIESGHLERLRDLGIEVHVRSIFLQGILLEEPESLKPWFEPVRDQLLRYRSYLAELGLTPLQGALSLISSIEAIDYVLVGVLSTEQMKEILASLDNRGPSLDLSPFACQNELMINPATWKLN